MGFSIGFASNPYQQQKQALVKQRYNDIYAHELAHKNAAGSLGGSIVIEKDGKGIPIGGHVNIKMPSLNPQNPDATIKHADTVIKAAMAPGDPSGQDYKVAAEAQSIKAQAQKCKSENKTVGQRLNIIA